MKMMRTFFFMLVLSAIMLMTGCGEKDMYTLKAKPGAYSEGSALAEDSPEAGNYSR